MSIWSLLAGFLALLWLLDGWRLRRRAASFRVLDAADGDSEPQPHCITRNGCHVDTATLRAASTFMRQHNLKVVKLLPRHLAAAAAQLEVQAIDPARFRGDRMARGRGVGAAFLVEAEVLARMGREVSAPLDATAFAELGGELKKYASTTMDVVVAPKLAAADSGLALSGKLFHAVHGNLAAPLLLLQFVLLGLCIAAAPVAGLTALAVFQLQPLLALAGTPLKPKQLLLYALLRPLCDASTLVSALVSRGDAATTSDRRALYAQQLAAGTAAFFEEPRPDCPLCGAQALQHAVVSRDRIQDKPGRFVIDRCRDCQHLFQNPRLSLAGLAFYYEDFYDGLGAEQADEVFSYGAAPYLDRARMLNGAGKPQRWLDVGAGHGHFCSVAREVWPEASFDALDLSASVEIAHRRGWAERFYRGLFPDLAPELARERAYDVISMSHYLEHTRDPVAEIAAAAQVLPAGGHLLIELPDPDCRLARIFGSYWFPWFQPQHQHLLSVRNLERLLRQHAFEPVRWHRGEAHQPTDAFFSLVLLLNRLAPSRDKPWHPALSPWQQQASVLANRLLFVACFPLLIVARLLDGMLAPALRRPGWSNTYRVLARRCELGAAPA